MGYLDDLDLSFLPSETEAPIEGAIQPVEAAANLPDLDVGHAAAEYVNGLRPDQGMSFGDIARGALSGLKAVGQYGVPLAIGAAGVMSALQGAQQTRALRATQQGERRLAEPAANLAGATLPAAQSALLGGPLPPGLEAQVSAWRQAQEQQIKQRLSSLGLSDSTMASQWRAWLDQQEQMLRQQLAQGLAQTGEQATVAASQALGGSAAGAGPQATSIAQYLQLANQAVQVLEGRQ